MAATQCPCAILRVGIWLGRGGVAAPLHQSPCAWNWQTGLTQNQVPERACGFESRWGHFRDSTHNRKRTTNSWVPILLQCVDRYGPHTGVVLLDYPGANLRDANLYP